MLSAAVPAFFPVIATLNFAFLSEVVIPTSIVTGTEQAQEDTWKTFQDSLIANGCNAASPILDYPLFQLLVKVMAASPSIFEVEHPGCNYNVISQEAQLAASYPNHVQSKDCLQLLVGKQIVIRLITT